MNSEEERLACMKIMKEKGIPMPPEDGKCAICRKKVNVMIPVNGLWVCKYTACSDAAEGKKTLQKSAQESMRRQFL